MSRFKLLKRRLSAKTNGRMVLRRDNERGVYQIEDKDAPFCHCLDRITVCYGLGEVEQFILSLT